MSDNTIYTRDVAADIVDIFERVLMDAEVKVPSPEDDERDPDNCACLYGSVYYNILDDVENYLIDLLCEHNIDYDKIIMGKFSGKK